MDKKTTKMPAKHLTQKLDEKEKVELPGYPVYPESEDVYHNHVIETEIDPEDISKSKAPNEMQEARKNNKKDYTNDKSRNDLDIPGTELDDEQEKIGSEDEENNYYSLGGDDHNDLDEVKGE